MIVSFAQTARADKQTPVVLLIQTHDPLDVDLFAIAKPILHLENIPYLATVEHVDPQNHSGFLDDGHYQPQIDHIFANAFIDLIEHR